jgi:hypothetical protein
MRTASGIPTSGLGPCAWSGIIPGPSRAFDKSLHEFCYGNFRVVLFVELLFYNTVVLGRNGENRLRRPNGTTKQFALEVCPVAPRLNLLKVFNELLAQVPDAWSECSRRQSAAQSVALSYPPDRANWCIRQVVTLFFGLPPKWAEAVAD